MIEWYVEGMQFGSCNCDYGCPCQFEALPSQGHCQGFEILQIEEGHFGDTRLDGLMVGALYKWPGPIFEGKGELQALIDERANEEQRDALRKIIYGEETEEAASHWWVFRAMSDTIHDPLFVPIEYDVDMDARQARVNIPGVLESRGEPIRSPVDNAEHRVQIRIPDGIEFEEAEIGRGFSTATAAISFDLQDTYGQFCYLRHSGSGVIRDH